MEEEEAAVSVQVIVRVQVLSIEGDPIPRAKAVGEALRCIAEAVEQPDAGVFPEEGKVVDVSFEVAPTAAEALRLPALTNRQKELLVFIHEFRRIHKVSPTLREIGRAMGIGSTNGVTDSLLRLERKGYIRLLKKTARGIVPTEETER